MYLQSSFINKQKNMFKAKHIIMGYNSVEKRNGKPAQGEKLMRYILYQLNKILSVHVVQMDKGVHQSLR